MSIEDNLENSKEQLIRNIALLNDSINKNSNEIDKNKLIVLLIEKYNINPFANMKVKDVATDLGMNQNNANDLFRRKACISSDLISSIFLKQNGAFFITSRLLLTLSYCAWDIKLAFFLLSKFVSIKSNKGIPLF